MADAIVAAGASGTVSFDCDSAIIQFDASNPQIAITHDITIDGSNNGNPIVLDGNNQTRFFNVLEEFDSHLSLSHITLQHGHHVTEGGAVNFASFGTLTAIDVIFRDNHTDFYSGAIDSDGATVTIQQSTFINNTADLKGGAIYSDGKLSIDQSTFINNHANGYGGGIYNSDESDLTINQSTFINNHASYGGGIYNTNRGDLTISQSTFSGNSAIWVGGVIVNQGAVTISQSSFVGNTAGTEGGAIALYSESAQITSSTFIRNKAPNGSAIYIYGVNPGLVSWSTIVQPAQTGPALYVRHDFTITGVILAGSGDHCGLAGGTLTNSYSLANDSSCGLAGVGSHQNVSDLGLGPLFTTTINGVEQSYYPLLEGSPAINTGSPTCDTGIIEDTDPEPDQIGNSRPVGPACDIGAIEGLILVPATLCANRWNGSLRMDDSCSRSETRIELPQFPLLSLCVNSWNDATSLGSNCSRSERQMTVIGDGSIAICVNRWNGALRVGNTCSRSERHDWL